MNNLTYTIIDLVALDQAKVDDCIQTSLDTVRHNITGDKGVLKWDGSNPSWVASLGLTTYTHAEILSFINNPANGWTEAE